MQDNTKQRKNKVIIEHIKKILRKKKNDLNLYQKGLEFFVNNDNDNFLHECDNTTFAKIINTLEKISEIKNYFHNKYENAKKKYKNEKKKFINANKKKLDNANISIEDLLLIFESSKNDYDLYQMYNGIFIDLDNFFEISDDNNSEKIMSTLKKLKNANISIEDLFIFKSSKNDYDLYQMYNGIFIDLDNFFDISDNNNSEKIMSTFSDINIDIDIDILPKMTVEELSVYFAKVKIIINELRENLIQCIKDKDEDTLKEAIFQHVILAVLRSSPKFIGISYENIARYKGMLNLTPIKNADEKTEQLWKYSDIFSQYIIELTSNNELDRYNNEGSLFVMLRKSVMKYILKKPPKEETLGPFPDPIPPDDVDPGFPPDDEISNSNNKEKKKFLTKMEITSLSINTLWKINVKRTYICVLYIMGCMTMEEVCEKLGLSLEKNSIESIRNDFKNSLDLLQQIRSIYEEYGRDAFNWLPQNNSIFYDVAETQKFAQANKLLEQIHDLYREFGSVKEAFTKINNWDNEDKWDNKFKIIHKYYNRFNKN